MCPSHVPVAKFRFGTFELFQKSGELRPALTWKNSHPASELGSRKTGLYRGYIGVIGLIVMIIISGILTVVRRRKSSDHDPKDGCVEEVSFLPNPKGPCRYMVYTFGPKGFPYTYFKAQVYPIYLHGPFG